MEKTKSFDITKQMVYRAYRKIKANKGAAGVDHVSLEKFKTNLKDNLYKLWNRLSSGSYFPLAVKAVEIPKRKGGIRVLGIPTVADRIAQMLVKASFEEKVEKHFLPDSYGYRPGKSAHDALKITRRRCWKTDWVLEFDIKGLFDNINHQLLLKAINQHSPSSWELLYIKRWLVVPLQNRQGQTITRKIGVPQSGVISTLLANLFLHYSFDRLMKTNFLNNPWCRYVDDGIIHCHTKKQAKLIQKCLKQRLQECFLELHPEKTRIVYCKDSNPKQKEENIQFIFLGYTFKPRKTKSKKGTVFTSFLPAISKDAKKSIYQEVRSWRLLWIPTNRFLT